MSNLIIPSAVRSLHNIFTSIWIGGMLTMIISVLPSIRKGIKDAALQGSVIDHMMSRHSKWVYLGIVILAVTGMLMARFSGRNNGLFNFTDPYAVILSIKHILMLLISVIAVIRSTTFKNAASSKDKSKKKLSMALLMVNTFLGVVILVLSSITAVIG